MPIVATYILVFFTALFSAMCILPATITMAYKFRFLDFPDGISRGEINRTKLHKKAIPRVGGLGIVLSFILSLALWVDLGPIANVLIGSLALFVVGFWDDLSPLSAKTRLLLQLIISTSVIYSTDLQIQQMNLLGNIIQIPYFVGFILSSFCLIGSINSINMLDGLDGLAAGVSLISVVMLTYSHYYATREFLNLTFITIALMGSVIGFLRYNSHPAKLFMGDGGSTWLGYMMGIAIVLSIGGFVTRQNEFSSQYPVPFISVLLIVAVPVLDTLGVVLKRLSEKRSPFSADQIHFHHLLLKSGLGQKRTVTSIYFLSVFLSSIGIFKMSYKQYSIDWIPYATYVIVMIVMIGIKYNFLFNKLKHLAKILGHSRKESLKGIPLRVIQTWSKLNKYTIYLLLALSPLVSSPLTERHGYLALSLSVILFISMFVRNSHNDFFHAMIVSVSFAMILFANNLVPVTVHIKGQTVNCQVFYNAIFIFIAISVSSYYMLTLNRRYLHITPTDFLLMTIPLVLLLIPEPWQSKYHFGPISARCFVIFMALRSIKNFHGGVARRFKILSIWSLLIIALRSILELRFHV